MLAAQQEARTASAEAWEAFRRTAPTGLAVVPVGILFGVLAAQASWSGIEVLLFSLFGFSGSGQFALLPLASQNMGFLTMLLVAVSLNSRYVPIAFASSARLPTTFHGRLFFSHLLGDEAYAIEQENDARISVLVIRATIYAAWVLSTLAGCLAAGLIPRGLFGGNVNLGFPASVVLLYLSFRQLKARLARDGSPIGRKLIDLGVCGTVAVSVLAIIGPVYFWIPSIAFSAWWLWKAGV